MTANNRDANNLFHPQRVVSWWSSLEDLLYPEKHICEKIKRKAEVLSKAEVDMAIQFGFHLRFDFAPYFGALHAYLANVAEELHSYGIKFLDHYSCNVIARPNSPEEKMKYHSFQRHHIDLYPDEVAAKELSYAGYNFNSLRGVDVRTGKPTYSWTYQAEMFCHNNPDFRAMHKEYLKRLFSEVPLDGLQADDMCEYAALTACGCRHCRDRFKKEYGYELPDFSDKNFWGNTDEQPLYWGNYENPAFRSWIQMRFKSVAEHLETIKGVIGDDKTLMTCCSNTGPNYLSSLAMQYDRIVKKLDYVMLENCGFDEKCADWSKNEPEAILQKSYAKKEKIPAIALGYAIYNGGAYLGWSVARFWGVSNWCSTLNQGMIEDPKDLKDTSELIGPLNRWEKSNSNLDLSTIKEINEIRLGYNRYCKENGWKDENSRDHWQRVSRWSRAFLERNIGYKFIRSEELSDADELLSEDTPIVLDGVACVSDEQVSALDRYVRNGGKLWVIPPFGTHDEYGFERKIPLQTSMKDYFGLNIRLLETENIAGQMDSLISNKQFVPLIRQIEGDTGWAVRMYFYGNHLVMHLLNRNIVGVAHPVAKDDWFEGGILQDIESLAKCDKLVYEIDFSCLEAWKSLVLMSPELDHCRAVVLEKKSGNIMRITIDVSKIKLYGVIFNSEF